MTERLQYLLLGLGAGLFSAFSLDAVRLWREREAQRRKTRVQLSLIKAEIERRAKILASDEKNWDAASDEVFHADGASTHASSLAKLKSVFERNTSIALEVSEDTAGMLIQYYDTDRRLWPSAGRGEVLLQLRSEGKDLLASLERESGAFAPMPFLQWLLAWPLGRG